MRAAGIPDSSGNGGCAVKVECDGCGRAIDTEKHPDYYVEWHGDWWLCPECKYEFFANPVHPIMEHGIEHE